MLLTLDLRCTCWFSQYLLRYYCDTNEAEMVELKTKRLFLKRSPCPSHFSSKDFALGSKVSSRPALGMRVAPWGFDCFRLQWLCELPHPGWGTAVSFRTPLPRLSLGFCSCSAGHGTVHGLERRRRVFVLTRFSGNGPIVVVRLQNSALVLGRHGSARVVYAVSLAGTSTRSRLGRFNRSLPFALGAKTRLGPTPRSFMHFTRPGSPSDPCTGNVWFSDTVWCE